MLAAETLALFQGFAFYLALLTGLGPQNAFLLRQGIGVRHVFAVASVCFVIDVGLVALAVGGGAILLGAYPETATLIGWTAVAMLFGYGALALRAALSADAGFVGGAVLASLPAALATAVAVSVINPALLADLFALGALGNRHAGLAQPAFAAGAVLAAAVWFYGLGYGARLLAPMLASAKSRRLLDLPSAARWWRSRSGWPSSSL
jgi:L-lysine exporter family protein LysE/ArgO